MVFGGTQNRWVRIKVAALCMTLVGTRLFDTLIFHLMHIFIYFFHSKLKHSNYIVLSYSPCDFFFNDENKSVRSS